MAIEATTARAIIKQAIKDETYSGTEPEDDATCVKEAEQLVTMAEQAWAQYIRGPEVETILTLANAMPQNGDEPQGEQQTETPPEPPQESEEGEQAPEVDLEGVDPELTKVEPWERYGEDRVSDITDGINAAVDEMEAADFQALISHIWAYEQSHKRRARVLKHVKEVWEKSTGGKLETPKGTDDTPPAPEDAPAETGEGRVQDEEVQRAPEASGEGSDAPSEPEPAPSEPSGEAGTERPKPSGKAAEESKGGGSGGSTAEDRNPAYVALVKGVERQLEGERLHIPKRPDEAVPDLPWRWADISNSDLHDYHMQYAAAAYYASYIVSRHERIAMHCREAADELHRELLNKITKHDEKGKPIPVTVLEAQIEGDPNVKSWRKRQRKHEQMASAAKREHDSYHKQVEALSRMETMRHQSWERARK